MKNKAPRKLGSLLRTSRARLGLGSCATKRLRSHLAKALMSWHASRYKPKASAPVPRSWARSCPAPLIAPCKLGFTLIEVLVSVMIIALVGTALLELSTKSVRIVSFLKQKEELPFMVAFAANHYSADDENLDKNFLDGVEKFYRIDSTRLKGFLNKNAVYSKDVAERIYFDDNSSALGQIEIYRHTIKTKTAAAYLYRIELPTPDLNLAK